MPDSRALLTRAPAATTALVFVHGFGGSAVGTWEAFPRAIRFLPETSAADAFFVDYPSTSRSVAFCATKFVEFLAALLRAPVTDVVQPSLPRGARRPPAQRYDRVVIAAHSMGAVVARRALLDLASTLTAEERATVRLLFFAPAHRGSHLPRLIQSGLGLDWLPGASLVGPLLTTHYRPLRDLEAGSDCLTQLAEHSRAEREACRAAGTADDHLRARVCHADGDKVVEQDRFDADHAPFRAIMRRDHRNVCKPDATFRAPVDELLKLL